MSVKFRVIVEALVLLIIVAVIAKQFQEPVTTFINTFGETRLASSGAMADVTSRDETSEVAAVDPDVGGEQFFATPRQLNILVYFGILAGAITLLVLLVAIRPAIASLIAGIPFLHFSILSLIVISSVMLALIKVFDAKDMMTIFAGIIGYTVGRAVARSKTPDPAPTPQKQPDPPVLKPVAADPFAAENAETSEPEPVSEEGGEVAAKTTTKMSKTGKNKVVQVFIQ